MKTMSIPIALEVILKNDPRRVSQMVLWSATPQGGDYWGRVAYEKNVTPDIKMNIIKLLWLHAQYNRKNKTIYEETRRAFLKLGSLCDD